LSGSGGAGVSCSGAATSSPATFFLIFFRILTRSTMRLFHPVLARSRQNPARIDLLGVVAERIEQRGRRERVDQPRNPAAQRMHLRHRLGAERITRAARHADSVLDVTASLLGRQRTESIAHPNPLPQRRISLTIEPSI